MVTCNIDLKDRLINGQIGFVLSLHTRVEKLPKFMWNLMMKKQVKLQEVMIAMAKETELHQ